MSVNHSSAVVLTDVSFAWPDGTAPGSARPRSATLAIRRRDGGIVGT